MACETGEYYGTVQLRSEVEDTCMLISFGLRFALAFWSDGRAFHLHSTFASD
jgi:hypothetical protein